MKINQVPDLTFPSVEFSVRESPWDLRNLIFIDEKNALTGQKYMDDFDDIDIDIDDDFVRLLILLHDELEGRLASGVSRQTVANEIYQCKVFFQWSFNKKISLSLDCIENVFIEWSEHLIDRMRRKEINSYSYKAMVSRVGLLIDLVLNNKRSIVKKIRKPRQNKKIKNEVDNILFKETVEFGSAIIALCQGLKMEVISGPLPIIIEIAGQSKTFWCLVRPNSTSAKRPRSMFDTRLWEWRRAEINKEATLKSRSALINLRIEAELLIFISQTGINLQQAFLLKIESFKYVSHIDGYRIISYKSRRSGEVIFEIFSEYRLHFENYIFWRNEYFKDDKDQRLFPFVIREKRIENAPEFKSIRRLFSSLNIAYFGPKNLRNTRLNWFMRKIEDPLQVADFAQNDVNTLIHNYIKPNAKKAMIEISRFHASREQELTAPGPGVCVSATPIKIDNAPQSAPQPDCGNPSGCLFCHNHRDIDSFDYIWSLASYRQLKILEFSRNCRPAANKLSSKKSDPVEIVIDRISEKMKYYEESSSIRSMWLKEVLVRIEEQDYHPLWEGFIELDRIKDNIE